MTNEEWFGEVRSAKEAYFELGAGYKERTSAPMIRLYRILMQELEGEAQSIAEHMLTNDSRFDLWAWCRAVQRFWSEVTKIEVRDELDLGSLIKHTRNLPGAYLRLSTTLTDGRAVWKNQEMKQHRDDVLLQITNHYNLREYLIGLHAIVYEPDHPAWDIAQLCLGANTEMMGTFYSFFTQQVKKVLSYDSSAFDPRGEYAAEKAVLREEMRRMGLL